MGPVYSLRDLLRCQDNGRFQYGAKILFCFDEFALKFRFNFRLKLHDHDANAFKIRSGGPFMRT